MSRNVWYLKNTNYHGLVKFQRAIPSHTGLFKVISTPVGRLFEEFRWQETPVYSYGSRGIGRSLGGQNGKKCDRMYTHTKHVVNFLVQSHIAYASSSLSYTV